jgi:putative membrane protein
MTDGPNQRSAEGQPTPRPDDRAAGFASFEPDSPTIAREVVGLAAAFRAHARVGAIPRATVAGVSEPQPRASDERDAGEARMSRWQREMLYQQRTRTDLGNERKYLGWLRVSLALITLGFIVERVDLFVAKSTGESPAEMASELRFAPMVIFALGAITVAIATWEFFADQRRIDEERPRGSRLQMALIVMTLVSIIVIAALLVLPVHGFFS